MISFIEHILFRHRGTELGGICTGGYIHWYISFYFTHGGKISFTASSTPMVLKSISNSKMSHIPAQLRPLLCPVDRRRPILLDSNGSSHYSIDFDAPPNDEGYSSFLMYLNTQNTSATITNIKVHVLRAGGNQDARTQMRPITTLMRQ